MSPLINVLKIADSIVIREWKLLFVNGCDCKIPISTVAEFFNSSQGGINR